MSTDPDQIRAQVAGLLADLPEASAETGELADTNIDTIAARLEEAHDLLVCALESVDRGPAAATPWTER